MSILITLNSRFLSFYINLCDSFVSIVLDFLNDKRLYTVHSSDSHVNSLYAYSYFIQMKFGLNSIKLFLCARMCRLFVISTNEIQICQQRNSYK